MSRAALILAVLGGLLLTGGTAVSWVVVEGARQVGGVPVPDVSRTSGVVFAPLAVPLGVLAALAGPALALRQARRLAGAVIALLGVIGAVAVGAGLIRAVAGEGRLATGPVVAVAGAVALVAGGVLAMRRPAGPGLSSRYTVEGAEDREWQLASDEDA
ncbi:MAG: Trp biosynthesis-associated membrane protein [Egibacteraceae bacterium]